MPLKLKSPANGAMQRARGSLSEYAYHAIREKILFGDLTVGTGLSRRKLATELEVSPVPVMEALQRLENEGLVETKPRVGTRVRVPTVQDIRDQFVLREALETQSARMFAEKSSREEQRELIRLAETLDATDSTVEGAGVNRAKVLATENRLHARLHLRIAECSGCAALVKATEVNQTLVFKWLYDLFPRLQLPVRWHQSLIEKISNPDPEFAEAAMREHVRHGLENVLTVVESAFLGQR